MTMTPDDEGRVPNFDSEDPADYDFETEVPDDDLTGHQAEILDDPKKPWKAVAAFGLTVLGLLWASLQNADLGSLGVEGWLAIIVPVILTTGTVYGLRNPKVAVSR